MDRTEINLVSGRISMEAMLGDVGVWRKMRP